MSEKNIIKIEISADFFAYLLIYAFDNRIAAFALGVSRCSRMSSLLCAVEGEVCPDENQRETTP